MRQGHPDPQPAQIDEAIAALRAGQVVALPTDTVYGLAASFDHPRAIERLYEIKGRESNKAIPVLIDAPERLYELQAGDSKAALRLAEAFWPGALTLVVMASDTIPEVVHRGIGTVGLRLPDHPVAQAVIAALGGKLAVTSANRSGEPEALTAEEARSALGGGVDVIVDGGRTPGGRASTVVDLTSARPRILRQGRITLAEIERALGGADIEE